MATRLQTVNPSQSPAASESLMSRLDAYYHHRAVIERDLKQAGITDTTPLDLADRIIEDAMQSAYACMLSAHRMAHAGLAQGKQDHHRRQRDATTQSPQG